MSDVFLSAGLTIDPAVVAAKLAWMPYTQLWSGSTEGFVWAVSRVDDPALWAPAHDPTSHIRVLLGGRTAFEPAEWAEAERLPYEGGFAARLILSRWLADGSRGIETLNGASLVVVIDENAREAHVWTDRMGGFPAFAWKDAGFFVMCSHPDVAASVLTLTGHPCQLDLLTIAEFLRTGTSTHPHTYWKGITHLNAGTRHRFAYRDNPRLVEQHLYWQPAFLEGASSLDRRELVECLSDALRVAIRRRTQVRLGPVAVMLSAGADSRAALFAACDPAQTTCYTVYDEPNPELEGARRLASAAGANHVALQRQPEYYIENAADAVRLSGGMWSIESAHFVGMVGDIRSSRPGVLVTGDYADYLFKGVALNRQHRKLFGRALPLFRISDFRYEFYLPFRPISAKWAGRVDERLAARFLDGTRAFEDARRTEYLRLAPLSRDGDTSTDLCLWRQLPYDPMMLDRDLLDVYGRMSVNDKLSGIAYGMAVARLVGPSGVVTPNNNYGARVGTGELARATAFVGASLKRKLFRIEQPFESNSSSIATLGSWPYFPRIVERSTGLREWLRALPIDQADLLFDIVGAERRAWSIGDWAHRDPTLVVRMFTASLWLTQNACVKPAAISVRRG